MPNLNYQINNRCQGWTNPSSIFNGPQISSLSGYYSPSGSNTLVAITGVNFYSYSTISFGTFNPTVYFINSNILEFYVPNTLTSGIFPVQVFNGSIASNIVNYTIDNASGYWILNPNGSISNTNTNTSSLVSASAISRGVPVTITSNLYTNVNPYILPNNVNWIICNSTSKIYITLPSTTQYVGREIMIKSINIGNVVNTLNNVVSLDNTVTSDQILSSLGQWVTLVYDGTNWQTMQANFLH
jgi:hypothetical protein